MPSERFENHPDRPSTGVVSDQSRAPRSVKKRIERLFLDNLGLIMTREQIADVAGEGVENWHQRLSELRTDYGYTILSHRDVPYLTPGEYVMPSADRRDSAAKRVMPTVATWNRVLANAGGACEWTEDGTVCGLQDGDIDQVGGGTAKLTPDHLKPHQLDPTSDPNDSTAWRALCARHQVMKKNFWDNSTGKMNYIAIVQAAPRAEKRNILAMLLDFFGLSVVSKGN